VAYYPEPVARLIDALQRLPGIGEVFQQPCGAAHVERGIRERKRLHVPDLKGNAELVFAGASPGLSDHGLARVEPDKAARRADDFHQVEHIGPWATPNFEHRRSWCQCHPLQHESLARLDAFGLLRLVHEPDEEVRIPGAVNLCEQLGMGRGAHADPPASAGLACPPHMASCPAVADQFRRTNSGVVVRGWPLVPWPGWATK